MTSPKRSRQRTRPLGTEAGGVMRGGGLGRSWRHLAWLEVLVDESILQD